MTRATPWLTLAVIASLVLAGCGQPAQPAADAARKTVTLALDWTPNTNHTGIYVAQQEGWYGEEGVELRILPYAEGTTTEQLVSEGKADVGISFAESVVVARAQGLDVVSIAAVIQRNTSALVAREDSGLDRLRALDGKLYAGFGAPFEEPILSTMIRSDGGRGTYRTVTANLGAYEALKAGRADFSWFFMADSGVRAEREGMGLNVFYVSEHGVPNYYTPVIVTSRRTIEADREAVAGFVRATARGYEHAIANPREAADLLVAGAGETAGLDPGFVRASQEWLSPRYKQGQERWGVQELRVWTEFPRFLHRTGKVLDRDGAPVRDEPDYAAYFTNEFLPE